MPLAKLVKNSSLKIYPGGTHSLGDTSKDQLNTDLLAFFNAESRVFTSWNKLED